ncbi:MAG TPA: CHAT domain-containing tetratricopeptide repeat protein [Pyrinomonadaceae bacterium]|jgi:CHAT domain-containing protein/tetratricopeptide (TPR) repeat protein
MNKRHLIVFVLSGLVTFANFAPPAAAQPQRPVAQAAQQHLDFAEALRQGRALLKRGKADQALPLLESALKIATDAKHPREEAAAHDALGDLYARQGQYEVALTHYQAARTGFQTAAGQEPAITRVVGVSDNSYNSDLMFAKVGDTYLRMGKLEEAAGVFNQMQVQKPDTSPLAPAKKGFGTFSRLKNIATGAPGLSTATNAVGVVGDVQKTFELYRQTILYSTRELGIGRVDFQIESLDSAKKHFENALAALGSNLPLVGNLGQTRRFRTMARTSLGDVALKQNRAKDALKLYTEALNGAKADKRLDLTWPAERGTGRAKLLAAQSERDPQKKLKAMDDALAAYRDALQTIEAIREGSINADEARTTFLATTKDVYDEASSALAAMALLAGKPGAPLDGAALNYAAEAFKITEQGRARSLLDMLNDARAEISAGVPADLLQKKRTNLERQQEIAQQLTGVSPTGQPPDKSLQDLEAELDALQTDYDSIENQIRSANPRYAALTGAQPLALADVQQQVLDDQTVLLEYSLGDEQSYLWAVAKGSVTLYQLPPRETLNKQVTDLRDQIVPNSVRRSIVELATRGLSDERGLGVATSGSLGNVAAFTTAANALYQSAFAPAAPVTNGKRLLIVADGALNYVPFEALVTQPTGADFASLPYLVQTNEIIYAPSASVVAALRQQQSGAQAARSGMLVVADPVFDPKDARLKMAPAGDGTQDASIASAVADVAGASVEPAKLRLARLTGTRAEAQAVAQLARAAGLAPDVWLDLDANEANVKTRDIGKYRVLHVATHGLLNTERPQFTGVVLSLVGNREGDGFLRTDEIFNLHLGAPLVMLSACETGLGREKRGEGIIGLTRAFMYAGAPTVGVSLWSVADKSTPDLMTDFYKRYLGKQSVGSAAALRAAQQQMIAGKQYSAPFHWAPFVLVGDWK